jgi:hypothetical protein
MYKETKRASWQTYIDDYERNALFTIRKKVTSAQQQMLEREKVLQKK